MSAFAANLKGDLGKVTIDTHAGQAAWLSPILEGKWSPRQYECLAEVYVELAREVGYKPAEVQAVVWVVWKRLYSPSEKRRLGAEVG
mgnify:CR=1 FL=1